MSRLKRIVGRRKRLGGIDRSFWWRFVKPFRGSAAYWEQRYARRGHSGSGSLGRLASFKARILNEFVHANAIQSVVEFGCGDGNQLELARYPRYVGWDVSPTAIRMCRERFQHDPTKEFRVYRADQCNLEVADLAVSLDVIFHLVEDDVFDRYMRDLFASATRFVVIYSSDEECPPTYHERHRRFSDWVARHATEWTLQGRVANPYPFDLSDPEGPSRSGFFSFAKRPSGDDA